MNLFKFIIIIFGLLPLSQIFSQQSKTDQHSIAISYAFFDVLTQRDLSIEGRLEYRIDKESWIIDPFVGYMFNSEKATFFYVGFSYDLYLTSNIITSFSFAPGVYSGDESKALNFIIQFRSQVELSVLVNSGTRIGISINHISNAGLGDSNPGVESFAITSVIPFSE